MRTPCPMDRPREKAGGISPRFKKHYVHLPPSYGIDSTLVLQVVTMLHFKATQFNSKSFLVSTSLWHNNIVLVQYYNSSKAKRTLK